MCKKWQPTPVLLPGKSHGWRSLVGCSPWGPEESETTEQLHFHFSLSCIGEGNGNPLQCSCLENSMDRRAWWATVHWGHKEWDVIEGQHFYVVRSVIWVYVSWFMSNHNKDLEWWTLKPPRRVTAPGSWTDRVIALRSWMDHVIALRQISVTAHCYSSILFRR